MFKELKNWIVVASLTEEDNHTKIRASLGEMFVDVEEHHEVEGWHHKVTADEIDSFFA